MAVALCSALAAITTTLVADGVRALLAPDEPVEETP
jgi:hypothetical protein